MTNKPVPELQLTFDALGFGPDMLQMVPHVFKRKKKSQPAPRTCMADPYGLCALRCQRQLGFRRSYALGEFIAAALKYTVLPEEGKHWRDFAYCVISAYAVAERYFLKPDEMFVDKRDLVEISGARHVAQHLAVEIGKCSTVTVGQVFDRHHASVRNAVDRVAALRLASPALEAEVDNLENVVLDLWAMSDGGEGLRKHVTMIA